MENKPKMHIDKYLQPDGYYILDNDLHCGTATSAIVEYYELGFCGCGDNESALIYLKDCLELIKLKTNDNLSYQDWKIKVAEVIPTEGSQYFMWYYLDSKGLTEHGGSVPGWLDIKGTQLLEDLTVLFTDTNETF